MPEDSNEPATIQRRGYRNAKYLRERDSRPAWQIELPDGNKKTPAATFRDEKTIG